MCYLERRIVATALFVDSIPYHGACSFIDLWSVERGRVKTQKGRSVEQFNLLEGRIDRKILGAGAWTRTNVSLRRGLFDF
jgi:hypothetical protein